MKAVRCVFMGSDEISIPLLEALLEMPSLHLSGIFTQPDKASGRGQKLHFNPIKQWALKKNLPVLQPERIIGEHDIDWIKSNGIEMAFVMAFGQLLRQNVLDLFSRGAWNFHPSLLPLYRGPCPMEAAILQGDKQTGVTLMQMILKMDAGAIVGVEPIALTSDMDQKKLRAIVSQACVPLIQRNIDALLTGHPTLTPQEEAKTCYIRKLNKQDGYLDFWHEPAHNLEKKIRAFSEWPGTFFDYQGVRLKVGQATVLAGKARPGEVIGIPDHALTIGTIDGFLSIQYLQKPGGRMLPIKDFLRGFEMPVGSMCDTLHFSEPIKPLITPQHQK